MTAVTVGASRAADLGLGGPVPARTGGPAAADRSPAGARPGQTIRSWPLLVLAAPAAAEVWSSWVGIAQKTGFGLVSPLPGIWPALHLDTAITLPVGVEAYAAYALRAWLARENWISDRTRRFARWSAICSRSAWPGRWPITCWPRPGWRGRRGRSPRSCPACRSWSWPWGPRWHTCCAPTPRLLMHQAAGPDRQPCCGPCPGPRRTTPDRAADGGRSTGTGPRAGTRLVLQRDHNTAAVSRGLARGPRRHRWSRPGLSPAGWPQRGDRCRGERCAAAASRAPTRR